MSSRRKNIIYVHTLDTCEQDHRETLLSTNIDLDEIFFICSRIEEKTVYDKR